MQSAVAPSQVDPEAEDAWSQAPKLTWLIRRDQLAAVRENLPYTISVNIILASVSALVAVHAGHGQAGLAWFAISASVSVLRIGLYCVPCRGLALSPGAPADLVAPMALSVERHLRLCWIMALASGLVWAFLPVLSEGYTSAQATFYLAVTCGITAGAVTHGVAFLPAPALFIAPPLVSTAACLFVVGGFDRLCLAGTVVLYLAGLTRGAAANEKSFREASRLKNEATALARSCQRAHAGASALAEEMRRRATHDDLSGLLNRAGFVQKAEERLRGDARAHCLMLLDLDGFKSVNDVYGHKMGDRVLVEVARRLRAALPPSCLAARIGGDEFAVFYDPAEVDGAPEALAGQLIRAVAEPFETFDAGRLGMSVGLHHAADASLTHMLSCADEAMYAAKAAGRNRFRSFDAGLHDRLEMRRDSERDLFQALAEDRLEVWFQPIFARNGHHIHGLEALVRWRHPVHGWIPPGDLVAAAAMSGLTETLLRFILARVCDMIGALRDGGRPDVRVAMNVSPREMAQIAVDDIVLSRLCALALPPTMLEVEITEEMALDIHIVQARLLALAGAGVRLALDDFGAGYSSLASLKQLGAERLKIDRSLVTGLSGSDQQRSLVAAVLGLGASLGLEVVAEGIETAEDLSTLQAMGCPLMQGYHLGRPAPAEDTLRLVALAGAPAV